MESIRISLKEGLVLRVQSLSSGQADRETFVQLSADGNSTDNVVANHLFADNVRFLSMAAIIAMHTTYSYGDHLHAGSLPVPFYYLVQPFKFGTIAFFLVAGFLFGERIDHFSPHEYFLRRLRNVFLPWCFWVLLWCVVRSCVDMLQGGAAELNLKYLLWVVKLYSTDGPYWFVPNLLIALALMLVLRRFLKDIRIGLVFLLASLFYSVNIYGHWITVVHTHAVFGFVFYLWLGAWGAWHFQELQKWLARIPAGVMFGAVILALCLTSAETTLLVRLGSVDPANTLRITNQICSVVTVLAFLKLKGAVWPDFVHVREHTFGVYLVHTVAISFFVRVVGPVFQFLAASPRWVLCAGSMVMLPALFAMVYGGSLVVVRTLLAYPKLRWMVGLPQRKAAKSKVPQIEVSKRAPSLRPHHQGRQFVVVNKT